MVGLVKQKAANQSLYIRGKDALPYFCAYMIIFRSVIEISGV